MSRIGKAIDTKVRTVVLKAGMRRKMESDYQRIWDFFQECSKCSKIDFNNGCTSLRMY